MNLQCMKWIKMCVICGLGLIVTHSLRNAHGCGTKLRRFVAFRFDLPRIIRAAGTALCRAAAFVQFYFAVLATSFHNRTRYRRESTTHAY